MSDPGRRYALGVFALAVVGAGCAVLILLGEARGGPGQGRWLWSLGGAALGLIFVVYGLILLLLRKLGISGPRPPEAEAELRGRWTKPVP